MLGRRGLQGGYRRGSDCLDCSSGLPPAFLARRDDTLEYARKNRDPLHHPPRPWALLDCWMLINGLLPAAHTGAGTSRRFRRRCNDPALYFCGSSRSRVIAPGIRNEAERGV
jgi:hypothetical protein